MATPAGIGALILRDSARSCRGSCGSLWHAFLRARARTTPHSSLGWKGFNFNSHDCNPIGGGDVLSPSPISYKIHEHCLHTACSRTRWERRCLTMAVVLSCLERQSFKGNLMQVLGPLLWGWELLGSRGSYPRNPTFDSSSGSQNLSTFSCQGQDLDWLKEMTGKTGSRLGCGGKRRGTTRNDNKGRKKTLAQRIRTEICKPQSPNLPLLTNFPALGTVCWGGVARGPTSPYSTLAKCCLPFPASFPLAFLLFCSDSFSLAFKHLFFLGLIFPFLWHQRCWTLRTRFHKKAFRWHSSSGWMRSIITSVHMLYCTYVPVDWSFLTAHGCQQEMPLLSTSRCVCNPPISLFQCPLSSCHSWVFSGMHAWMYACGGQAQDSRRPYLQTCPLSACPNPNRLCQSWLHLRRILPCPTS